MRVMKGSRVDRKGCFCFFFFSECSQHFEIEFNPHAYILSDSSLNSDQCTPRKQQARGGGWGRESKERAQARREGGGRCTGAPMMSRAQA